MKKPPQILWSEGMFLRPHHLQAADRYREDALREEIRRIQPFFWGLMSLEVAPDQLENYTFDVRGMEIKLKDGTSLTLGGNLRLFPRAFKTEIDAAGGRMEVHVGVPVWQESFANTFMLGEKVQGQDRRASMEMFETLDENTGANAQQIESKRYNGRLFFGNENREGYETLPIAVVERSGQGKNYPVLSRDFIPAVTEIGASSTLRTLCESVTNRLEAKHRLLLSEVSTGKLSMEQDAATAWQTIMKLQTLGSFTFVLQQITRIPRVHPFLVYCEFTRLAGELAIFGDPRKAPQIPLYDHDRLGPCYFSLCHIIETLAEKVVASRFVKVDFVPRADLQVADLVPEWLVAETEIYLSIETDLDEKEIRNRMVTMKLGAVADIPVLVQRRLFGLDVEMLKRVPTGLPAREDYYYFTIEKEGIYWSDVVRDKVMAISGANDPKMKFSLYIITKPGAQRG